LVLQDKTKTVGSSVVEVLMSISNQSNEIPKDGDEENEKKRKRLEEVENEDEVQEPKEKKVKMEA